MIYFSDFGSSGGGGTGTVTLNPSDCHSDILLSNGNLRATKSFNTGLRSVRATRGIAHTDSGYFEIVATTQGGAAMSEPFMLIGVSTSTMPLTSYVGHDTNSWGYYQETGTKATNTVQTAYGASWGTTGDIIGVAFKNGSIWFRKNGTWQNSGDPTAGTGAAFTGITGTLYPTLSLYRGAFVPRHEMDARFKAADFTYAAPSGFLAWEY